MNSILRVPLSFIVHRMPRIPVQTIVLTYHSRIPAKFASSGLLPSHPARRFPSMIKGARANILRLSPIKNNTFLRVFIFVPSPSLSLKDCAASLASYEHMPRKASFPGVWSRQRVTHNLAVHLSLNEWRAGHRRGAGGPAKHRNCVNKSSHGGEAKVKFM